MYIHSVYIITYIYIHIYIYIYASSISHVFLHGNLETSIVVITFRNAGDMLANIEGPCAVTGMGLRITNWILGRSVVFSGEHSDDNNLDFKIKKSFRLPSIFGKLIMNSFFISIFNRFYYLFHKNDSSQKQDIDNFFYPLDKLSNWNEFYGKRGFTQLQILIKDENKYEEILYQILNFFISKKIYSYLSTLKEYGKGNDNYLSFAENGLSITLDIPIKENFFEIYQEFERIISSQNVKIYLAKDSFMSKNFFKNSYHKISLFKEIKKKIDPESKLQSIQSRRLGL